MLKLKSIENASLVRKFSVLFSLMSLFPFIIISLLFFYFSTAETTKLDLTLLFGAAFLVGLFALIGFFGMRSTLKRLGKITKSTQEVLEGNLSQRIDIAKVKGDNEVAQIARAFNDVVHKLESNIKELEKSKNLLQSVLTKVASGVSSAENIEVFLDLILETTLNALDAKSALLLLAEEENKELVVKATAGVVSPGYSKGKRISINTGAAGWVLQQKEPLFIPFVHKQKENETGDTADVAFRPPLICAPLIFQNKAVGVISIRGRKSESNFKADELVILSNLAGQIALAIENAKLSADAQKSYLETITALAMAVEARDHYSRGHAERVAQFSVKVAKRLNLDEQKIDRIREAALLHDVGKIGISDEILKKEALLDDVESKIMQQHPAIGEGIIIPLRGFFLLRDPIRHHHEWLNGQGYPDGLTAEEISLEARILAVTDSYDAMTTERSYRKAMSVEEAKKELLRYKGIRYDAKVVEVFLECT